jgi:septal ring factor EnvC (AmiA/AmiB activator)
MEKMKIVPVVLVLAIGLIMVGCSSAPSEEEMRQLNDLKAEVASLEQQVAAREKEKSDLEKQVAEKNVRLQQCSADKDAVEKGAIK